MTKTTKWTLAAVVDAHESSGGYFFSRSTMKVFGDTRASFRVINWGERVFVERVKPMRDRAGINMGGVGDIREFFPETGRIGAPYRGVGADQLRRDMEA